MNNRPEAIPGKEDPIANIQNSIASIKSYLSGYESKYIPLLNTLAELDRALLKNPIVVRDIETAFAFVSTEFYRQKEFAGDPVEETTPLNVADREVFFLGVAGDIEKEIDSIRENVTELKS